MPSDHVHPIDLMTFDEALTERQRLESRSALSTADMRKINMLNARLCAVATPEVLYCEICGRPVGTIPNPPSANRWDYDSDMCMDCSVSWDAYCATEYQLFLDEWAAFCGAE